MKPTFALDLTRETIGLLHRTPKGWLSIGDVAFDAPDLAEALDYLRKTALGLSPMGVATKLILPNSQILYTEVHAPGPSRDDKRRQIAAALEGQTPYPVEELAFDWSGKGAKVKVAVVAKETLAEAEAFAVEHRLNPVSFVAIPDEGAFVGEPWFGPTAAAASILAEDETVDRDREPVAILHRELPRAEPAETAAETIPAREAAPESGPESGPEFDPEGLVEDYEPLPGLEEALNADLPAPETPEEAAPPVGRTTDDPQEDTPQIAEADATDADAGGQTTFADAFAAAAADPEVETPGARPKAAAEAEPEEAPFAHVTDTTAFPEDDADLPPARKGPAGSGPDAAHPALGAADRAGDDIPPAPSSAAMVAFASRRAAAGDAVSRPVNGVTRPAVSANGAAKPAVARPAAAAAKGFPGLVTAPSIPGTRAKVKIKGSDIPRPAIGPTTVKSPARPGGTFGTALPAKRRSGTVFMVMVGLLLLFLALVAAWASYFIGSRDAEQQSAAAVDTIPDASPDATDEMLADLQDPEELDLALPEAGDPARTADLDALATETLPVDAGSGQDLADGSETAAAGDPVDIADLSAERPEPAPETLAAPAPEPAPEPAPATTVTTEVAAATPPVEDQDEIFLSAMDAPPPALDALALPPLAELRDSLPDPVMPPPAPGTVYQFDAAGLLRPTPDGILSPDGVFLIAGKPPLLPPSRSEVATAAAQAAAAVSTPPVEDTGAPAEAAAASLVTAGEVATVAEPEITAPADPEMAGFRPRARPEDLTPPVSASDDDASLGAASVTQFATLRPLPRPASVAAAAAAVLPASAAPADLGAQGASLTAQAEAKLAEAAALEAQNPSIVAISMRPAARPLDMSRAVEAAVAAAVREPAPKEAVVEVAAAAPAAAAAAAKPDEVDELDEPEVARAAPSIPTKASVAKQATFVNAINLSKINLIGTYGTDSRRYALIRQSNGKYKKVKVGDKFDGGTVKAITETEVRYQKGGRLVSLKMPKA